MDVGIQALDEPRPLSRRSLRLGVAAVLGFGLITAWIVVNAGQPGPAIPATAVAHAVAMFAVTGFTALILLGYARSSGRRGFLILGGTYTYVCIVMAMLPFFFPNGITVSDPPAPLLGGMQGSITLFWAWHFVLLGGIVTAAVIFVRDRDTNRRSGIGNGIGITLGIAAGGGLLTFLLETLGADQLPVLIQGDRVTSADMWPSYAFVVASIVGTTVTAFAARNGSVITRWLLAVSLMLTGEAFVIVNANRYSWGWYYNRAFGFLTLSVLLIILVWTLGRIGRATDLLASYDQLTGAERRSVFLAHLSNELTVSQRTGQRTALLWLDLDGFKGVNDELGHHIGDRVLCVVVRRIRSHVRLDDRVGRLGGDEFGLLLRGDVTDARIDQVASSVLAAVREPIALENTTTLLTASIGVAVAPHDATEAEALLLQADLAMYAGKKAGGDRCQRFTDSLESAALNRARMRQQLSAALREDDFELQYQPIVDTVTGHVAGVESLVRWLREGRPVEAREFIEFAEQSGQVLAIGRSVIRTLERDLPRILDRVPRHVFVSLNMSVKELADDDLVQLLLDSRLQQSGARLLLEVTESFELEAATDAERNLERIREAGIPIAIDDFGTGYSNLLRLARLQPTILKVDRGLVARAGSAGGGNSAFLAAAHGIAVSLDCDVIAEGVESPEESHVVTELGIRYSQGFHHARPMPLDDLLDLFETDELIRL